jgi:quinol monooxygenase YgiN
MIHVVAVLTAKPGLREKVLEHFRANVPNVLAENGCYEYGAAVDAATGLKWQAQWGADTFLVIEKWDSVAALEVHAKAPHMAAYAAKTKDMIANRAVYILNPS